jgi:16S rRNA processing protein RimM
MAKPGRSQPTASPPESRDRICVAQIGAPHGVLGEVRVRPFTENPEALAGYGPLEIEDGSRRLEIEAMRPAKGSLIVRFFGISDRNAAALLRSKKLYVPRTRLPEPEADTYYHADLIGLAAVGSDGTALGNVRAVQNFGAGDLLEIAPADGGPAVLLPFTRAFVPLVDIPGGRLVTERLSGLVANREGGNRGNRTRNVEHPPPHPSPSRGEGGGCR